MKQLIIILSLLLATIAQAQTVNDYEKADTIKRTCWLVGNTIHCPEDWDSIKWTQQTLTPARSDTVYRLANEIWNCGDKPTVRYATVHNGRIWFDWEGNGVRGWKSIAVALRYWRWEGTAVVRIK